jgi:hypothetical protein
MNRKRRAEARHGCVVMTCLRREERHQLELAAAGDHASMSEFIRTAILRDLRRRARAAARAAKISNTVE